MYKIGIDVGGTTIKCGIVKGKDIVYKSAVNTPVGDTSKAVEDTVKLVKKCLKESNLTLDDIVFVGAGLPGTVHKNVVTYANNLDWYGVPFARLLSKKLNKKVVSDNDARCAIYAEQKYGAGVGAKDLLMITLGTGVGTAFTLNGSVHKGYMSAGGEGGIMVYCDGVWEDYASTLALVSRVKKLQGQNNRLGKYLENKEIDGKTIFTAEKENIKGAKEIIDEHINYIADGVVSLVNLLRPEIVIIGGAIAKEERIIIPLQKIVRDRAYGGEFNPEVKLVSAKIADAGIIGATLIDGE